MKAQPGSQLAVTAAFMLLLVSPRPAGADVAGTDLVAGYTRADEQLTGPALKRIAGDPLSGIHIMWEDDLGRARYNFYDLQYETWRWPEGTAPFSFPHAAGNLAPSPLDRKPHVCGNTFDGGTHRCYFAFDTLIGSGRFWTLPYEAPYDLRASRIALTGGGTRHFADLRHDTVNYHRTGSSTSLGRNGPFPSHNIAASHTGNALAVFWSRVGGPTDGDLYLRRSTNTGSSWRDTIVPSRRIPEVARNTFPGAFGDYDERSRLHIVTAAHDGSRRTSSALWHYCENDTPEWSLIHRGQIPDTITLDPGDLAAGRPSIAFDPARNRAYAVWEQFNPDNVEPATGRIRADIWAAASADNGRTWGEPLRLTAPDRASRRYPCVATPVDDDLYVMFLVDSIAGASRRGAGRATRNPVICRRVPAREIPLAVAEPGAGIGPALRFEVVPSIVRDRASLMLPDTDAPIRLALLSPAGRVCRRWSIPPAPGLRRIDWFPAGTRGGRLPPGVYFLHARIGPDLLTRTIVIR